MAVDPPPPSPPSPPPATSGPSSTRTPARPGRGSAAGGGAARRRTLYGINVAVAVGVAVALVVLVNVLVDWQFRRLPAGLKPWLRYDLTATRSLTLAPQTQRLLADLPGPMRMVGVLREETQRGRDVADLLQQYARYGATLEVETLHPERDLPRVEAFYRELEQRYRQQTQPLREAVVRGVEAVGSLATTFGEASETLTLLASQDGAEESDLSAALRVLGNQLGELSTGYARAGAVLREQMQQPMAPVTSARAALVNDLRRADAEVLAPFLRQLEPRTRDRGASLKVRDGLLRLDQQIRGLRERLRAEVEALLVPASADEYERLRSALSAGEVVVVAGPAAVRVVPIEQMVVAGGGEQERLFIGEDRLTGAMLTMNLAVSPRLVVVRDTPSSLIEPRGGLSHVAGRMALADFEVVEWSVGGGGGPGGEAAGGGSALPPPPALAADQPTVWVVPSLNLERTTQADRERVAEVLGQRLAAGDGLLLCFDYDAEAAYRPADPLVELARSWGLVPRRDQLVLREDLGADGRRRGDAGWVSGQWPAESPLAGALAGRDVQWVAPTPLEREPRPRVEAVALARLGGPRAWRATGLTTPGEIAASRYSDEQAIGEGGVLIAAAAEKVNEAGQRVPAEGGRMMVFTERHWLTDTQAGRRLGNSELFVNAAYWLAGLDEAIAATPRTQDLRRIRAIEPGRALGYRWLLLAGLPGLVLVTGVGVGLWRRRG